MAKGKKKDYTNYAAMSAQEAPEVVDEVVEEIVEEVEVAPVEEPEIVKPQPLYGVVTRCEKLNMRKKPSTTADIVTVLDKDTKVRVYNSSNPEWHCVTTELGVSGYCMAHYIKVIEG